MNLKVILKKKLLTVNNLVKYKKMNMDLVKIFFLNKLVKIKVKI